MLQPSFLPPTTFAPPFPAPAETAAMLGDASQPSPNDALIPARLESVGSDSMEGQTSEELRVPRVVLQDAPAIAPDLAAALAGSLLGHVLFLKGQIPLPVAQLARLPPSANHAKAKRRTDLLAALDTLAAQLRGTFAALARALEAREAGAPHAVAGKRAETGGAGKENARALREGKENVQARGALRDLGTGVHSAKMQPEQTPAFDSSSQVHLVYALGPTPSVPKARVVFALRGLASSDGEETFEDGSREDSDDAESEDEDSASGEEEEDEDEEDGLSEEDEVPCSDVDEGSVCSADEDEDQQDAILTRSPPENRGHLFTVPRTEPTPAPAPITPSPSARVPFADKTLNVAANASPLAYQKPPTAYAQKSRAEVIKAAERALSRALAEDGRLAAASAELAPTHTHVLLRAPRRFAHPAWKPRENLGPALDACVADALAPAPADAASAKRKPEGVLVCAAGHAGERDAGGEGGRAAKEEDELIWWVWDGRLTGFADW